MSIPSRKWELYAPLRDRVTLHSPVPSSVVGGAGSPSFTGTTTVVIGGKIKDFSSQIPGLRSTYEAPSEEAFMREYADSLFALTKRKAGWDCLRHYEILCAGAVPYFLDHDSHLPPASSTMEAWPRELVSEAMRLPGVPSQDEVEACVEAVAASASIDDDDDDDDDEGGGAERGERATDHSSSSSSCLRLDHTKFDPEAYLSVRQKLLDHAREHLLSARVASRFLNLTRRAGATLAADTTTTTSIASAGAGGVSGAAGAATASSGSGGAHHPVGDDGGGSVEDFGSPAAKQGLEKCVVVVHSRSGPGGGDSHTPPSSSTGSSSSHAGPPGRFFPNDFLRDSLLVGFVDAGCTVLATFDGGYLVQGLWSRADLEARLFGRGFFLGGSLSPEVVRTGQVTFGLPASAVSSHLAVLTTAGSPNSDPSRGSPQGVRGGECGGESTHQNDQSAAASAACLDLPDPPAKQIDKLSWHERNQELSERPRVFYVAATSCNGPFPSPLLLSRHDGGEQEKWYQFAALVDGNDIDAPHAHLPPPRFKGGVFRREGLPLRLVDF